MMDSPEIKARVSTETILAHYGSVQDAHGHWKCIFPERHTNGDQHPSVTVKNGRASCWSQKCFEGADQFELVRIKESLSRFQDLGRRVCEIGGIQTEITPRKVVAEYDYQDSDGGLLYQVVRYEPKAFAQRRPDGDGGYVYNMHGVKRVLYRLPALLANPDADVVIHEGEKAVDAAIAANFPGCHTTTVGGADNAALTDLSALVGRQVIICPDHDEAGERYGKDLGRLALEAGALSVRLLRLPGLPEKGDVVEWLANGGTKDEFAGLLKQADIASPPEKSAESIHNTGIPWTCSLDLLTREPPPTAWLIHGVLPREAVVLFSGREGTMKSWLALDWARSVADGEPWLDRQAEAGGVLYVDAEMPGHLFQQRLQAIGGSKNLSVWRWQDQSFPTMLDDSRLIEASRCFDLIIIDTLRRFMQDLKENTSDDMAKITDSLRQLTRCGATVIAIHHALKDDEKSGYRGSTELGAGVDITLDVVKSNKDGEETLRFSASKTRFAEDPRLTVGVQRGSARPVFRDVSGEADQTKQAARADDLKKLQATIVDLTTRLGRKPNQSEIVTEAKDRSLGGRNMIIGWLRQGQGSYWTGVADGRSLVYETLQPTSTYLPVYPSRVEGPVNRSGDDCTTSSIYLPIYGDMREDRLNNTNHDPSESDLPVDSIEEEELDLTS